MLGFPTSGVAMEFFLNLLALLTLFLVAFPGILEAKKYIERTTLIAKDEYECTVSGYFPHPQKQNRFYHCHQTYESIPLASFTFECANGLCFDGHSQTDKCSAAACAVKKATCLDEHFKKEAEHNCFDETLDNLDRLKSQMVHITAHRGDVESNLKLSLRDLNMDMRQNYAKMIENTGKNVFPLMIATDYEQDYFGVGGVFKVYFRDGSSKRIVPVSPAFEMHKSLSHIVLGIFSIISPYFLSPVSINWVGSLTQFRQHCKNSEFMFQQTPPSTERTLALNMLASAIAYMDNCIATSRVDIEGYHAFATRMAPLIEQNMKIAAEAHARDTIPALQKLKDEMGEEEWGKMFVVIPAVWGVSSYNIRLQALEKVMSAEQVRDQVFIVEGVKTEDEARTTLGRIISDRAIAQLVWGGSKEASFQDHVVSLSTRRDIMSSVAQKELKKVCADLDKQEDKPKCPFSGRS